MLKIQGIYIPDHGFDNMDGMLAYEVYVECLYAKYCSSLERGNQGNFYI